MYMQNSRRLSDMHETIRPAAFDILHKPTPIIAGYTVSAKHAPTLVCSNFDTHKPILIILAEMLPRKYATNVGWFSRVT